MKILWFTKIEHWKLVGFMGKTGKWFIGFSMAVDPIVGEYRFYDQAWWKRISEAKSDAPKT